MPDAENEELQRQILALNALATKRGLVVTLGDVMFETGKAELRGGVTSNLDNLAAFLNTFLDRTVLIEGHTDNVGTDSSNMRLLENRANSVESYLVKRSVEVKGLLLPARVKVRQWQAMRLIRDASKTAAWKSSSPIRSDL